MKIRILQICVLLITTLVYGQQQERATIIKGTKEISLSVNYGTQKNKEEGASATPRLTNFLLAPSIGFAIKNNLVLGAQINYIYNREKSKGDDFIIQFTPDVKTYGIGFFPYIKKYVPLSKTLWFNIQASIGYQYLNQEEFNDDYVIDEHQFRIGVSPGVTFNLSDALALKVDVGFLGYSTSRFEDSRVDSDVSKQENFDFSISSSEVLIGLVYFIKPKRS